MNIKNKILGISIAVLAVLTMATLGAYAAPSADLDQCRNGPANAPVNCTGAAWVNGNVGEQQGHLVEGYSIPYRARMFQLPAGTSISLVLGYDIKHSDKNAIDYLTYFQRFDSPPGSHLLTFGHPPEIVDPASGVSFTGPTTTFSIPPPSSAGTPVDDQPNASFNDLTADEKIMTLFGGTITDIKYITQGSLTDSQSETRIMVNFTTNSTCPVVNGVQQCTAVLSWSGHIASRIDWGFINGVPNSAAGISGSPYHMRLITWNLGNLGNQDRSLAAAAVVAPSTITIIKDTIPNDPQVFSYTTNGTGLSAFSLADNGTGQNTTVFGGLASGIYTVQEGAIANFNLTALNCIDPSGDTITSLNTRTASINLAQGESVICKFENTKNAILTIVKDAIPNDDQLFNFAGSTGIDNFDLKDNGTSTNSLTFSLPPGTYSVGETEPAGWKLTNIAIVGLSGDSSASGNTANINLAAGENGRVTFTNTKNATIIVKKTAIGGDDTFNYATGGGDNFPPSFSLTTSGGKASQTFNNILPDQTYSVSEDAPPAGWVLTNSSCTKGTPASFSPAPGETVICTFENTRLHLSFIKEGSLDFAAQETKYSINVTNDGYANLTIVNMTDETGILICDTAFPRLLAVGDKISCSILFATDTNVNAATIIEILAQPNIFWRI